MNTVVEAQRFHGYGVGSGGGVTLTHLQFADDTIIIGEKSLLNVRTMRAMLLFEEVLGLKVNFNKSMLTGINISESWLSEAALVMNCWRGTIPFIYLGLPIGGDSRKLSFWKHVVDRIVSRLSSWNNKFLSSGGRLVLLKGRLQEGGRHSSTWWRMLSRVREGVGEGVVDKECSVAEMCRLGWAEGAEAWIWRRRLLAWEEENDNVHDTWRWYLDPTHGYSVRVAYRFITTSGEPSDSIHDDNVWHRLIPAKVSLFVWRLMRNRLPTKDNLVRRRVLPPNGVVCVLGCGE
ncbi:uncharacterized protein [Medicago truncatula]|uniref:uncharacterized protein n=1 Tax=Medicago truncatula TaxID=3880 RepID=UPI000D2F3900|nr:uncharacterized protein LOC112419309 [Medicago truncatula]